MIGIWGLFPKRVVFLFLLKDGEGISNGTQTNL